MLLDSNIVIYAVQPVHTALREFIAKHAPGVSVISQIEVLGYHSLETQVQLRLEEFFAATEVLPLSVSVSVVERAIRLRQERRMSLGDSVVAATALVNGRTRVTHNIADFRRIANLELLDPLGS